MQCSKSNATEAEGRISAYVAESVARLLQKGGEGEILMVNSGGIYLSADRQIVFLSDASWGRVPIGIAMDGFREAVAPLCLECGQTFTFRENTLNFRDGTLHLLPKDAAVEKSPIGEPRVPLVRQAALELVALHKAHGISMLALPLLLEGEPTDAILQNPYAARAYPLLLRLMHALWAEEGEEVRSCVSSLLGLGSGLTPSADDVMLGMLYVFHRLPYDTPSVSAFRESISELSVFHTNRVSAAYLDAILGGEHFERMDRVYQGLCGTVPLDITALTEIGNSSGSEMLLGMLLALRICGFFE